MADTPSDFRKLIISAAEKQPIQEETTPQAATERDVDFGLSLEGHRQEFEIETLWQALRELQETHRSRIQYIGRIFWLVVGFLACVVWCIALTGYKEVTGFNLSDKVLIAFITSTTVTVVGLFVVVAKWLYPAPNGSKTSVKATRTSTPGK